MQSWGRDREVEKPKTKTQQVAAYQARALRMAEKLALLRNVGESNATLVSHATLKEAEECLRLAAGARRIAL